MARPTKDPKDRMETPVTVRFRAETVAKLKDAGAANSRGLGDEIRNRIEESLDEDSRIGSRSRDTLALFELIDALINEIETRTGKTWKSDVFTHKMFAVAIGDLIQRVRPIGRDEVPSAFPNWNNSEVRLTKKQQREMRDYWAPRWQELARDIAAKVMTELQMASRLSPAGPYRRSQKQLLDVVERQNPLLAKMLKTGTLSAKDLEGKK